MMTLEYLDEQKTKYQQKQTYFNNIGFDTLAAEYQRIVDLIEEMKNYIKEKENGEV
jgi:hypothetical protein